MHARPSLRTATLAALAGLLLLLAVFRAAQPADPHPGWHTSTPTADVCTLGVDQLQAQGMSNTEAIDARSGCHAGMDATPDLAPAGYSTTERDAPLHCAPGQELGYAVCLDPPVDNGSADWWTIAILLASLAATLR